MDPTTSALHLPARHVDVGPGAPLLLPTVYCWMFPQVRALHAELMADYPHELYLRNVHPGLDDAHEGLLDAYEQILGAQLDGWATFSRRYVTGGSSEGIFHLLAAHAAHERSTPIYVLDGEYAGYGAYAAALGLQATELSADALLGAPAGRVFVSWPSARDGRTPDRALLDALLERHRVVLDLAYLGLTDPFALNLEHPGIDAVVASLSKPFGLYYQRVGMLWARQEMPSLYGTRWFKNLHSILLGEKVIRTLGWDLLPWIRERQHLAVAHLAAEHDLHLAARDVALLAGADAGQPVAGLERFRRGAEYRVCLTPLMMTMSGDGPEHAQESADA